MENNVLKSVCSKDRLVSSANIIGSSFEEWGRWLIEYNLEFQGSVRNLQKRALFMKAYPEMP